MKEPGPDHPITIEPADTRVRVAFAGRTIAETSRALKLCEGGYPPVYYIPRADATMDLLRPSDHSTHCPYKGDAGYFDLAAGEAGAANAVWTYADPYPAVVAIKDHLAFYPEHVSIELGPRL